MQAMIAAVAGGALIGLAAVLLLLATGQIAGISGILGGLLETRGAAIGDAAWRIAFIVGLLAGPFVAAALGAELPRIHVEAPVPVVLAAGVLVGFGTRLGNGCTSGHGVCGLARGSQRSAAATLTFMGVAVVVVFTTRHLLGG